MTATTHTMIVGIGIRNGTRFAVCPKCGKKGYFRAANSTKERCKYCKIARWLLPGQYF